MLLLQITACSSSKSNLHPLACLPTWYTSDTQGRLLRCLCLCLLLCWYAPALCYRLQANASFILSHACNMKALQITSCKLQSKHLVAPSALLSAHSENKLSHRYVCLLPTCLLKKTKAKCNARIANHVAKFTYSKLVPPQMQSTLSTQIAKLPLTDCKGLKAVLLSKLEFLADDVPT